MTTENANNPTKQDVLDAIDRERETFAAAYKAQEQAHEVYEAYCKQQGLDGTDHDHPLTAAIWEHWQQSE